MNDLVDFVIFGVQEEVLGSLNMIGQELQKTYPSLKIHVVPFPHAKLKEMSPNSLPRCGRYLYVTSKETVPRVTAVQSLAAKFGKSLIVIRVVESGLSYKKKEFDEKAAIDNTNTVLFFDGSFTLEQLGRLVDGCGVHHLVPPPPTTLSVQLPLATYEENEETSTGSSAIRMQSFPWWRPLWDNRNSYLRFFVSTITAVSSVINCYLLLHVYRSRNNDVATFNALYATEWGSQQVDMQRYPLPFAPVLARNAKL